MARCALHHASVRINGRRHPRVRIAQQPAVILDRPHPRHVQVLPGSAGVAIPAVVGDIHEYLRSILHEFPHLIGKD